jgi:hypothetical protein
LLGEVEIDKGLPDALHGRERLRRRPIDGRHQRSGEVGGRAFQARGDVGEQEAVVGGLPAALDAAPGGVRDAGAVGGVPDAPAAHFAAGANPVADDGVGCRSWRHARNVIAASRTSGACLYRLSFVVPPG